MTRWTSVLLLFSFLLSAARFGFRPTIGIRQGLRSFAEWYRDYRDMVNP